MKAIAGRTIIIKDNGEREVISSGLHMIKKNSGNSENTIQHNGKGGKSQIQRAHLLNPISFGSK